VKSGNVGLGSGKTVVIFFYLEHLTVSVLSWLRPHATTSRSAAFSNLPVQPACMHPFATYVLRSYYKATGWNEDNLYANFTRSSNGVSPRPRRNPPPH